MSDYFKKMDWEIVIPYILLCLFGIVMVFSASAGLTASGELANHYVIFQSIFVVIGVALAFLVSFFGKKIVTVLMDKPEIFLYLMIAMFIILVYLLFFGTATNGASGWIRIGPLSIQPAEFCKPLFIIFFALLLVGKYPKYANENLWVETKSIFPQSIFPIVLLGLIFLQPDTGGCAINAFIIFIMILAADPNWKSAWEWLIGVLVFSLVALRILIWILSGILSGSGSYKIQRFVSYLNPFKYIQSSGHQLVNSYYAMSNGGLFGVGLGNSIQKMGYLSEPNTDFIIAIITEELGIIGVTVVLALLAFLIIRIVNIALNTNNLFNQLICYGTAAYLFVQTLFNAGGAVGLVPLTGVALPFISYGGSSLLALSICIGMVIYVSADEKSDKA